jgi:hypothetical protein
MLKAGAAQFTNWLAGNDTHVAYDWTRDIDRGWAALNPEQQAQLIQDVGTPTPATPSSPGSPSYVQRMEDWGRQSAELIAREIKFQVTGIFFYGDPVARAAEKRAIDQERLILAIRRPKFVVDGHDYTAEADNALANLRNKLGAP